MALDIVTNTADSGTGSLRFELRNAAAGDTIVFSPTLSGGTITLLTPLAITKNVVIDGHIAGGTAQASTGTPDITLSGGGTTDIMTVVAGTTVRLDGLDIVHGFQQFINNATAPGATGSSAVGGILNAGALTVTNTVFSNDIGYGQDGNSPPAAMIVYYYAGGIAFGGGGIGGGAGGIGVGAVLTTGAGSLTLGRGNVSFVNDLGVGGTGGFGASGATNVEPGAGSSGSGGFGGLGGRNTVGKAGSNGNSSPGGFGYSGASGGYGGAPGQHGGSGATSSYGGFGGGGGGGGGGGYGYSSFNVGRYANISCFATGTSILTPLGGIAVEQLRAGDHAITHAPSGVAPIIWIGTRSIDLARHPRAARVAPIRVAAGAFAPNRPDRDLLLSPDHAVFVAGRLIPVALLVNDTSIRREPPLGRVAYFHVELDRHAILLANNLAAESYLDTGNRADFANCPVATLHPDFSAGPLPAKSCAPVVTGGRDLDRIRAHLARRAASADRRFSAVNCLAAGDTVLTA